METAKQDIAVENLLQHAGWLRSLAGRLVGESGADDLVQETYLAAIRSPPDEDRPAKPWLARVARNAAKMTFRADSRREQRESVMADFITHPESPTDSAARVELQTLLCELVLALPEPYRSTVVGLHFDGLQAVELAQRDSLNAATVRQRYKHALGLLRDMLDKRNGGDRRSWLVALIPIAKPSFEPLSSAQVGGVLATQGLAIVKLLKVTIVLVVLMGSAGTAVWATRPSSPELAPAGRSSGESAANPQASQRPTHEVVAVEPRRARRQQLLAALRQAYPQDAEAEVAKPRSSEVGSLMPSEIERLLGLDPSYVQQQVKEFMPLLKECYENARTQEPGLAGTLVLEFAILGDKALGGLVEEAHVVLEESSMANEGLTECATETLYALEFKPPHGGGRVVYKAPFTFKPLDSESDEELSPRLGAPTPRSASNSLRAQPTWKGLHNDSPKHRDKPSPEKIPAVEETLKCDEVFCLVSPEQDRVCCSELARRRKLNQ